MDLRFILRGKSGFVQAQEVQTHMGARSQFLMLSFKGVPNDWVAVSAGEDRGGGCSALLRQWSSPEIRAFCFTSDSKAST